MPKTKKVKKPSLMSEVLTLANEVYEPKDSYGEEILSTYNRVKSIIEQRMVDKYFPAFNVLSEIDLVFSTCKSVSQTWNLVSGKIWVASVVTGLVKRGHKYELEVPNPALSKGKIDLCIDGRHWVELKHSCRERLGQISSAYRYKVSQVYFVTTGTDLSVKWVERLGAQGITCVTVAKEVKGALTADGWLERVTDRWGVASKAYEYGRLKVR